MSHCRNLAIVLRLHLHSLFAINYSLSTIDHTSWHIRFAFFNIIAVRQLCFGFINTFFPQNLLLVLNPSVDYFNISKHCSAHARTGDSDLTLPRNQAQLHTLQQSFATYRSSLPPSRPISLCSTCDRASGREPTNPISPFTLLFQFLSSSSYLCT